MYRHLLVPFDGSPFSARALPIAAELCKRTGATLHLVMVHDPSSYIPFVAGEVAVPVYDAELVNERRAEDQRLLAAEAATLDAHGLTVVSELLEGTTVEALTEYAAQVAADLIVMSTHGRGGFARLRLGSVATACLARSNAPVLLVRGGGSDAEPTLPTGVLLCPMDGSQMSEAMLPHARTFAEACGMSMSLLAVTVPHHIPMAPLGTELLIDPSALEAEEKGQDDYLATLLPHCTPGATTRSITDLDVARAVLDEAERLDAGAIAMATHGRSGLRRMMLGSVTDEVVRHTPLPVLVYRPDLSSK